MNRTEITVEQLVMPAIGFWERNWALLSCGDFTKRDFNSMTISWGGLGNMWGRPFALVVVRPQRLTRKFMDSTDNFTVSVFALEHKPKLELLGSRSGRDMDKINASGFTPIASTRVSSPSYAEAELILECRKNYYDDLDPRHFIADYIAPSYGTDYHRIYFGEILAIHAADKYRAR